MQNRQTNQVFNFDELTKLEKDIDLNKEHGLKLKVKQ